MPNKNRYMGLSFHKPQILNFLLGRRCVFRNSVAALLVCFIAFNIALFDSIIARGIASRNLQAMLHLSLDFHFLAQCCLSDPDLGPCTIHAQHHLPGNDPANIFHVEQPMQSQMVHRDSVLQHLTLT